MTTTHFKFSVFSPMLFISIVACAPGQNQGMPMGIRPVAPTSDALITTDEAEYQGAVRAINDRDYGRALDYLQAARGMRANDVRVLNAFGVVYDKLGRFDLSARYYAQALAADPHSAIVLKNVAYSHVLQGMAGGDGPGSVMAAVSLPDPAAQALAKDQPLDRGAVTAHDELALEPQLLSGRAPMRVAAAPPPPADLTAASLQIPDLGPVMAPAELALAPQLLPRRAPVMVAPVPPAPAALTVASLQTPDLATIMAPAELALEPQLLPRRAPVMVASVPPAPVALTAASLQTPDLGPVITPAELPLGPQMLPQRAQGKVAVAPLVPAPLAAASIETPDLAPPPGPAEPAQELKIPLLRAPVRVEAAPPAPAVLTVASIPDLAPLQKFGQTKSMRLAEALVQKSQATVRSPREPAMAGHHLSVINATGQGGISEPVRQQLLRLGWTAPLWAAGESANQSGSTIRYARPYSFTAHALARTIPFPVQLALCVDPCNGIELIVGRDYLEWKPKSSIARRWSSSAEILTSSVQRSENDRQ